MKKIVSKIMLGVLGLSTVALSVTAALAWFGGPKANIDKEIINGDIGLRGYFYDGDGLSEQTAFEVVAPVHYYNLTRLQNLGIFPEKRYFQLGHDFGGNIGIACLNTNGEGETTYDKYLDLEDLCESTMVLPIGDEATPFYGTFNGNGISVKNLTVSGYPEDIGVFGYVAHEGVVKDVVFEDLTVTSLGYTSTTSRPDYELFNADIENLFADNVDEISRLMSLNFYDGVGDGKVQHGLKKHNGLAGTALSYINADAHLFTDSYIYKGYFEPVYPVRQNEKFTYSWKSSSPLIREAKVDIDNDGTEENAIVMDLEPLKDSTGTDESFNSGNDMQADARLSLIASVTVDGFTYSRVIQSYKIEFYSNSTTYDDKGYSAALFCDYVDTGEEGDRNTNYHHGNNIGLLAGHVDGTFENSFIYKGKLDFNKTGYTPIDTESDTALIGEIGSNVRNDLDPEVELVKNGDIGVMNFSRIYSLIRRDMDADEPHTLLAGRAKPDGSDSYINYISYDDFKSTATFDNFSQYLRHDSPASGPVHYIIPTSSNMSSYTTSGYPINSTSDIKSDFNAVDFIWNQVVQDEENIDRGLGVFKLVTGICSGYKTDPNYAKYMLNGLGNTKIVNGTPKSKVYFSTAEYEEGKGGDFDPNRGISLPEYSDVNSFGYPFSRDLNYCFELNLEDMGKSGGKNYMWNTDSPFLVNYLKSKLIDKLGNPVSPKSNKFGFMFRSSENELLTSLSSYMPINKPGSKYAYEVDGETKYYPSSSIVFRIDNEFGANVSVVGNTDDITIYRNNPNSTAAITPLYSMKCSGQTGTDQNRYFRYDVETGVTDSEAVINESMTGDGGALYGHIFKLPQGDYVLGARNNTAHLYFLAVQGQNNATLGDKTTTYIGSAVENCDFITEAPSLTNVFPFEQTRSLLSFKMNFNSLQGEVSISTDTFDNKKYISITFLDNPRFVTYLFLYSRHTDHRYFVNGQRFDTTPTLYPRE